MKLKIRIQEIIAALVGIFFVSCGVAFNNCAGFGNDAIGALYDGIRVAFGMNAEQLGRATDIVNISLAILVFFLARRYISLGTIIYLLPYGLFVDLGSLIYRNVFVSDALWCRVLASAIAILMLSFGIAVYIVLDIGVDPFTGIILCIADFIKKQYGQVKVGFDICMIVVGFLLGGKVGVVTFICAFSFGPLIQWFSNRLRGCKKLYCWVKGEEA